MCTILKLNPELLGRSLYVNKIPRRLVCSLESEKTQSMRAFLKLVPIANSLRGRGGPERWALPLGWAGYDQSPGAVFCPIVQSEERLGLEMGISTFP